MYLLVFLFFLYFAPSFTASSREHPNIGGIIVVNIFLGWTLIGWVVALAWACSGTPPKSAGRA